VNAYPKYEPTSVKLTNMLAAIHDQSYAKSSDIDTNFGSSSQQGTNRPLVTQSNDETPFDEDDETVF